MAAEGEEQREDERHAEGARDLTAAVSAAGESRRSLHDRCREKERGGQREREAVVAEAGREQDLPEERRRVDGEENEGCELRAPPRLGSPPRERERRGGDDARGRERAGEVEPGHPRARERERHEEDRGERCTEAAPAGARGERAIDGERPAEGQRDCRQRRDESGGVRARGVEARSPRVKRVREETRAEVAPVAEHAADGARERELRGEECTGGERRRERGSGEDGKASRRAPVREREGDARAGGGRRRHEELGLRQEREAEAHPGHPPGGRSPGPERRTEGGDQRKAEQHAVGLGVLVGRHPVVVREPREVAEAEADEERRADEGPRRTTRRREEPPGEEAQESEQDQVAGDEGVDGHAEEAEPEGVQVRGERPVPVGELRVEAVALDDPPRQVELGPEVDDRIGPAPPARRREAGEEEDQAERPEGALHEGASGAATGAAGASSKSRHTGVPPGSRAASYTSR